MPESALEKHDLSHLEKAHLPPKTDLQKKLIEIAEIERNKIGYGCHVCNQTFSDKVQHEEHTCPTKQYTLERLKANNLQNSGSLR